MAEARSGVGGWGTSDPPPSRLGVLRLLGAGNRRVKPNPAGEVSWGLEEGPRTRL